MKLSCNIIKDLWILYENNECSEDSKHAVEQHLSQCDTCRQTLKPLILPASLVPTHDSPSTDYDTKVVQISIKKIKRRWIASILATLSILPLILFITMGINQYRGEGICYTNLDEIALTYQFLKNMSKGNMEEAAKQLNYRNGYDSIREVMQSEPPEQTQFLYDTFGNVLEMSFETYKNQMQERFLTALNTYKKSGAKITDIIYYDSYYIDTQCTIRFQVTEHTADGRTYKIILDYIVEDNTLTLGSSSRKGNHLTTTPLEHLLLNWELDY